MYVNVVSLISGSVSVIMFPELDVDTEFELNVEVIVPNVK